MSFKDDLKTFNYHGDNQFPAEFHVAIKKKLVTLLKSVCNIDLSTMSPDDGNYFSFDQDYNQHYKIKYHFNYTGTDAGEAEALVILSGERFFVSFQFYKKEKHPSLPAGAYCVDIDVDERLRYIGAEFETRYDFGWKLGNPKHRATFLFYKVLDKNFKLSTVINCINRNSRKTHSLLKPKDLPALFFENNHHFYDTLKEMLEYCEMQPNLFYSVFSEYPDHIELASSSEAVKKFLTLYHDQFTKDSSIVESRLLLLEMQDI